MKKIMIFAAFAAALSMVSCHKAGLNGTNNGESSGASESPSFSAEIDPGSKTTIDAISGKVSWETTDEITITDNSGNTALYGITSIDGETGRAMFEYKSGDPIGKGPYTATYGTAPATAQTYSSETPGRLYMTATSNSKNLTFTVQCGLMEIKLTKGGVYVKSVAVIGTPAGGLETAYIMTCAEPLNITETKTFYVAVPAGIYNKYVITNKNDKACTLTAKSDIEVAANHIKAFSISNMEFSYPGVLPGKFSVSATKQVYFSKGNLWAEAGDEAKKANPVLHFENAQYEYLPISDDGSADKQDVHVSHFTWSSTLAKAVGNAKDGDYLFCNEENKVSVENSANIFYALSMDEWGYLFNTREVNGGKGAGHSYTLNITYGRRMGLVLYPDDYTGSELSGTVETLPEGVVFLPAAGSRSSSNVTEIGKQGQYWSSSSSSYIVKLTSSNASQTSTSFPSFGRCLRLVVTVTADDE